MGQRISQCNDVLIRFKKIPSSGIALQIDGEAWIIREKCTLRVQIHDKLPAIIGYNEPRGVQSWLQASLDDAQIVKAKHAFRKKMRNMFEGRNGFHSRSQSPIAPISVSSGDEKESKTNIVDKIINDINQSSSQIMSSIFNMNRAKSDHHHNEIELDTMEMAVDVNGNEVHSGMNRIPGLNQISKLLSSKRSSAKTVNAPPKSINFNE